jgi:hypothetical protein
MTGRAGYIPILKGRQGELLALSAVNDSTKNAIRPLIELVPRGERGDEGATRDSCDRLADTLGDHWGSYPAFLDAGLLDQSIKFGDGGPLLRVTRRAAEQWGVKAIPVLRVDDPPLALQDAAKLNAESNCGLCIRLVGEDLDREPEELEEAFQQLLGTCQIERTKADIVVDAGAIESEQMVRAFARMLRSLVRDLERMGPWRSLVVASGAFPADLSAYAPRVLGERSRFDADLWAQIVARGRFESAIDFGDYAIAHPLLGAGVPFTAAPQLRYTTADKWLILKGRRNDPAGYEQFYTICRTIADHEEFAGAALGGADARIANPTAYGPGNATTWRQIGTAHHLDFVALRLATFGEP